MKKLVLILGFLLSLCANAQADENVNKQEFVNPIFYQQLQPMSIHSGYVYLAPSPMPLFSV